MKNVNDILPSVGKERQATDEAHNLQGAINPKVKSIVDQLFEQLASIFPAWQHNWKTKQDTNNAKKEWVKAIHESGINTLDQIRLGMMKARKSDSDFLPSPGKFITWCKKTPEDAGWPNPGNALNECNRHRRNQSQFTPSMIYIKPLIKELVHKVGRAWYEIDRLPNDKAMKLFTQHYQDLFDSGYVEPEKSDSLALPTKVQVMKNMSKANRDAEKNRALSVLDRLKGDLDV